MRSLSIDGVSLVDADGTDLIDNGSFETVDVGEAAIVSNSLVMTAQSAMLAVSLPAGAVSWKAVPTAGGPVLEGRGHVSEHLDALPLTGLAQGHYELQITDSDGVSTATAVALLDVEDVHLPQDSRFGVGLHVERDWYRNAGVYAAALGFGEARNDILWARNETTRGAYDWDSAYEREFDILHSNDVKLLGIVNYNNKLYSRGKTPTGDEAVAAYGRYARAIADRFDLVGLEVFNEFNHHRFNDTGCGTSGACYVPLLQAVHGEVGPAHPDLPIVAGSTALYDQEFFRGLWQAGGMAFSDVMSFHPYEVVGRNPDGVRAIVDQAQADMVEHAGSEVPVWVTELGWTTKDGGTSLSEQSEALVRAEVSAIAAGAQKYFWYDLVNDSPDAAEHEGNFGLYEHAPSSCR